MKYSLNAILSYSEKLYEYNGNGNVITEKVKNNPLSAATTYPRIILWD